MFLVDCNQNLSNMRPTAIYPIIILAFLCTGSWAQSNHSLFFMDHLPQSVTVLPTYEADHRIHLGIPLLSSSNAYLLNSGFRYRDFISRTSGDSLELNMARGIARMKPRNYFSAGYRTDWIRLGLQTGRGYFSLNISEYVQQEFHYPRGFFELLWHGNAAFLGQRINMDGMAIHFMHYREMALGYSQRHSDELHWGVRLKYLSGVANVHTFHSQLGLTTDEVTFALIADGSMDIRSSGIYRFIDNEQDVSAAGYLFRFNNPGAALDAGVKYLIDSRLTLQAAITDLGFIWWNHDVRNYAQDQFSIEFSGIHANDFFRLSGQGEPSFHFDEESFDVLLDSLAEVFALEENSRPYTTAAPLTLRIGAGYEILPGHDVGIITEHRLLPYGYRPSLALGYTWRFRHFFALHANYAWTHWESVNFGLGMSARLGPVQVYAFSDNITGVLAPLHTRHVHAQIGVNLLFGRAGSQSE